MSLEILLGLLLDVVSMIKTRLQLRFKKKKKEIYDYLKAAGNMCDSRTPDCVCTCVDVETTTLCPLTSC